MSPQKTYNDNITFKQDFIELTKQNVSDNIKF